MCAGLDFWIFPVALIHEFKSINSVRKSGTAPFFPAVSVVWKESHMVLCLLISSPMNFVFPSSHWHTFRRGDAGKSSAACNLVPMTLSQRGELTLAKH